MPNHLNIPLTIITVCKNRVSDIAETCESIIQQTWQNFEWIVVDGASDDGTAEILSQYAQRMNVFISETDTGVYNAMNKGIKLASGKWLLFLNGGDRLASESVLKDIFAKQEPEADILFGNELREKRGKIVGYVSILENCPVDKYFFAFNTIYHQAAFIKKALFEHFGLYDEKYMIAADWEKWVVFAENGCSFKHLDLPVSVLKMGGLSSRKDGKEQLGREMAMMREAHYSQNELARAKEIHANCDAYSTIYKFLTLFGHSFFKIEETLNRLKIKYSLFGIPIIKGRRVGPAKQRLLLFGALPLSGYPTANLKHR